MERHTEKAVNAFDAKIANLGAVLECYLMTGPVDYLLKVMVADLADYENIIRNRIHTIGCVGSIDTGFVYGKVKKTSVYPAVSKL